MRLIGGDGGDSCEDLGFEGNLPRRPFKLSVRTTINKYEFKHYFKLLVYNTFFARYINIFYGGIYVIVTMTAKYAIVILSYSG